MEVCGHIGKLTTMTLVRSGCGGRFVPVIAAVVSQTVCRAGWIMLGAEAVQVGTFVL